MAVGFVVVGIIALLVGMRLARLVDGSKGARSDYKKARDGLPGARKKAFGATFGFVRFVAVIALIVVAFVYGWVYQTAN